MELIGKKIRYNKDMTGIVLTENDTHILIQFEKTRYCVAKNGIEKKDIINGNTK
jgi:hypothetical protein